MRNSDQLYTAMRDFTNARREHRDEFLRKKKQCEQYEGSKGYDAEMKALREARTEKDNAARLVCKKAVDQAIQAMITANSMRRVTAPTDEQLRLLQAAQMLKKPSKTTLDAIANSLGGNALALAALTDIARSAWADDPEARFIPDYSIQAGRELTAQVTTDAIKSLSKRCAEIMNGTGANRTREMGAEINKRIHGANYDPDDLPQEAPYMTEQQFYEREIPGVDFSLFCDAVNDQGGNM